jgi:glycosyltransferase involved in cell wall biosynthesis
VRWIAFGSYDVRRHPRVGVLIDGLRDLGDEVTELNVPLPLDTAGRVAVLRQPWRLPLLAFQLLRCWWLLAAAARRYRRHGHPAPDAVLVGYLGHFDVHLARLLFRRTPIVLDHLVSAAGTATDRGLAGPAPAAGSNNAAGGGRGGGVKLGLMRAIDRAALGRADVVVVDTRQHQEILPPAAAARSVVTPVGASAPWFAAGHGGTPDGGPLKVIFVGLFTPLHGAATIGAALGLLAGEPGIEVTMVGTGQDHAGCRRLAAANSRVRWLDWVATERLPALVADHHVSLGIFGTTDKARRVVPTKVYQGAAAGCAVVTSDTPPQRAALGDAGCYVPPGDPEALAATLRLLAAERPALSRLRAAARAAALARYTPAAAVTDLRAATTRLLAPAPAPTRPHR